MAINTSISRAVRLALVAAAVYGSAASAQEAASKEAAELEQVVVTGSRLATSSLDSVAPMQIISSDVIDSSGVTNIQDVLLKSPEFGAPAINRTNSNFSTSSAGVATVDLRNLGTSRTLVLVNGRRFVPGVPGDNAVDLNAIPTNFIERVDVLTGGASSLYGSDAVAGVVNFVYKRDYEGLEIDGQYGATGYGDNATTDLSITMGTNSADGRGNIAAFLGYSDQGAVYSRDRHRTKIDQISLGAAITGDKNDFFKPYKPFYSSFAPTGRFFLTVPGYPGSSFAVDADGNPVPWCTNGGCAANPNATGFNRSQFRTIAVPTERYNAALTGNYEWMDGHRAFMDITYAATNVDTELEPYPLSSSDVYPATFAAPLQTEYTLQDGSTVILDNPTAPQWVLDNAGVDPVTGLKQVQFTRRMAEIGNRGNRANRNTFNATAGFEGKIFDDKWNYNAWWTYGQTTEAQTSTGQVNVLNFRNALQAVPDVEDIDGDGNTTEAICADANARDQGCVPANIYGAGALSPAAVAYIQAPGSLNTQTTLKDGGITFSGDVYDLPAGPLAIAFGGEYQAWYSISEFDALQQAGLNAGNALPTTKGSYNVGEGFIEANIPLLADMFMAEKLDLRGAYRYSDYSTTGGNSSWNAGLEWQPISQLRFRGTAALSTRAPNINELYQPPSQNFPTGIVDPCDGVAIGDTSTLAQNCFADPGVVSNAQANGGVFTLTQADIQGISTFESGNPDLDVEKGHSWTVGLVYTPENVKILENFAFTLDYWNIEIDDAITFVPVQLILNQCYASSNAQACDQITRRETAEGAQSAGSLDIVNSSYLNGGKWMTDGIDFVTTYNQDLENWGYGGGFNARLSYTHVFEAKNQPVKGEPFETFNGEIGAPKDRAFLNANYVIGDFAFNWQWTYIGESCLDDLFLASYGYGPNAACVDDWMYSSVQMQYNPAENVELYIGGNNIFDKDPAPIISGLPGDDTGTETAAGVYDAIGRTYYGGIRVKF